MKSFTVLLLAFALFQITLASVQYPPKTEDVLAFWSTKKMQETKPLEMPILGEPTFDAMIARGGNTREVPANLIGTYPYATAGKLLFHTGTRTASCSAVSIGHNVVLTAGHCVHDGSRNYYTQVIFVPQFRDGNAPKGRFVAESIYATPEWQRSNGRGFSRDVGYVIVKSVNGKTLEETVGKVTPKYNLQRDNQVTCLGYPGNYGNAQRLIMSEGKQSIGHSNMSPTTTKVPSRKTFGASGGPWIINGKETNGVNSYIINSGNSRYLYGPFFDSYIKSVIDKAFELSKNMSKEIKFG